MGFYVLQKAETALREAPRTVVDVASPVRESMQMWNMGPKTSMHKTHFLVKWLRCTGSTSANMSRILDSTRLPFQLSLVSFSLGVSIHCLIIMCRCGIGQFNCSVSPDLLWHGLLWRDWERQEDQVWGPAESHRRHHGAPHRLFHHQRLRDFLFRHQTPGKCNV